VSSVKVGAVKSYLIVRHKRNFALFYIFLSIPIIFGTRDNQNHLLGGRDKWLSYFLYFSYNLDTIVNRWLQKIIVYKFPEDGIVKATFYLEVERNFCPYLPH
jgi:hypothetical protein